MRGAAQELLTVCEGDVLLIAASWTSNPLDDPQGQDRALPSSLVEKPNEITPLTHRAKPFALRTRIADCYAALRVVHAMYGSAELSRFFSENDFVEKSQKVGNEIEVQSPDDPGMPRRDLYLLLRETDGCIRRQETIETRDSETIQSAEQGEEDRSQTEMSREIERRLVGKHTRRRHRGGALDVVVEGSGCGLPPAALRRPDQDGGRLLGSIVPVRSRPNRSFTRGAQPPLARYLASKAKQSCGYSTAVCTPRAERAAGLSV